MPFFSCRVGVGFGGGGDVMSDAFERERERMVEAQIAARGVRDPRVLAAMRSVPRHRFTQPPGHPEAYRDHPLTIGEGQTISQPYIVALMTEALALQGDERVLEIGTGSGYQTAVLAELAAEVYTVERLEPLAAQARERFKALGLGNIHTRVGDGTQGWPEQAPYDAILVTAASPGMPRSLTEQLVDGGRMVIPVGGQDFQTLNRVTRKGDAFDEEPICSVRFVKLIGQEGWGGVDDGRATDRMGRQ
jgi:protein-L-isoaspartate(D-aspartate) O-methyltransferase